MISELKIRNFKSLESVDLKLGHFNLLVGANASGKSNFLDALRFLQGVAHGFSVSETLNGRPPSATGVKWDGIRGGSPLVAFRHPDGSQSEMIEFHTTFRGEMPKGSPLHEVTHHLTCRVARESVQISHESVDSAAAPLVDVDQGFRILNALARADGAPGSEAPSCESDWAGPFPDQTRSVLATLVNFAGLSLTDKGLDHLATPVRCAVNVASNLAQMQFLDPLPKALRSYSTKVAQLGEDGEGFAALIHEIESNGSKPALLEWLKELRPDEVSDLLAIPGAVNDYMAAIKEGATVFPAPAISDGTLRFIALAAAFFQPSMPKVLVVEEIEKGLHPSRLRLLLELMRSQSKRTGTQVFATTHSPTLLNWLTPEDRKTTFVCTRDVESGATKMRSLAEVPRLEELIQKNYNLDQLFEEGWLESVLHES